MKSQRTFLHVLKYPAKPSPSANLILNHLCCSYLFLMIFGRVKLQTVLDSKIFRLSKSDAQNESCSRFKKCALTSFNCKFGKNTPRTVGMDNLNHGPIIAPGGSNVMTPLPLRFQNLPVAKLLWPAVLSFPLLIRLVISWQFLGLKSTARQFFNPLYRLYSSQM